MSNNNVNFANAENVYFDESTYICKNPRRAFASLGWIWDYVEKKNKKTNRVVVVEEEDFPDYMCFPSSYGGKASPDCSKKRKKVTLKTIEDPVHDVVDMGNVADDMGHSGG
ncbi:hypothetical protein HPULCUR_005806 [Helicostylum pulchrum]|uniref:Uncharacterized protein n=1 Tax=Helicostylum pulchrum TaxID=562976 RepID=A0ABP9Y231_9FUNG